MSLARLNEGGFAPAFVDDAGTRPACLIKFSDGRGPDVTVAPVFSDKHLAENPPRELTSIRRPAYVAVPVPDTRGACEHAAMLREGTGRPVLLLWDYRTMQDNLRVTQDQLFRAEDELNGLEVAIPVEVVEALRDAAWKSGKGQIARLEHDRFVLHMAVQSVDKELHENLVVRYRGTPRQLLKAETEAVLQSFYDLAGIDRDEIIGPAVMAADGRLVGFRRVLKAGPRRA